MELADDIKDIDIKKYIKTTVGRKLTDIDNVIELKTQEADWITKFLALNHTNHVLDYGAGFGFIANAIADKVDTVHTYDVDKDFIRLCKDTCKNNTNIQHHGPKQDTLCDISVDTTILKDVVENFTFDLFKETFKVIANITKPNGKIFFNYYNREYFDDAIGNDINHAFFTAEQIQEIANHINFKVVLLEKDKLYCFVLLKTK